MSSSERVDETSAATSAPGVREAPRPVASHWFGRLIDRLLPDDLREADRIDRNQGRMLACVLLILLGAALAILVGRGSPEQVVFVGYASTVIALTLGMMIGLRLGVAPGAVRNAMLAMIYLASMGLVFASGGAAFSAAMVACLLPIIAYGVGGRRAAVVWSGMVALGIVVTAVYAEGETSFPYSGELLAWEHWRFQSFGLMLFFLFLGSLAIDWVVESAESETLRVHEQMESQEARYRDLVENVGDVMLEFAVAGECVYASPHTLELIGRAPEDLLGFGYRAFLHPDDHDGILGGGAAAFRSPGTTISSSFRAQHVNGHWVEGELTARAFYDDRSELHLVSICRDLSELHQAERAVRHSDRLASAGTLAAGIAHQINNPIGSIRNAAEYALICAKDGEFDEVEGVLRSNIEQAARCGEIVRSLLLFASHEPRAKAVADLRDVVERACELARSYAGERGIEIDVAVPSAPLLCEISSIEIEQVFVNLVRNAIEAKPKSRRVEVRASKEGDRIRIEIQDDGRGISRADRNQVFDPFFTTRLEEGGSGLGLSVALGIAREHGGALELESREGEGSTARLWLPVVG